MTDETKFILGIMVATILLVAGIAVFGATKSPSSTSTTSSPADPKLLIRPDSEREGKTAAKVTIVEFGDYQCPACGNAHPELKRFMADYADRVELVFRNFPLPQHQNAVLAAKAAEAAGLQGKFWPMHDRLYERQNEWSESTTAKSFFTTYAKDLGLNVDQFTKDLDNATIADHISSDQTDGNALGVDATPTLYINGQKFPSQPVTYTHLKAIIDPLLAQK